MPPYTAKLALTRKLGLEGWMIRSINRTNTGWAVKAANMEIRDKLLEPENKAIVQATLGASAVDVPEEWVMYVVPKVPATVPDLDTGGPITITSDMVLAEARDQTGASPTDAHMSRHGVNPETGDATWVVAFRETVRRFRLFKISDVARKTDKQNQVVRHDPGCQGYHTPHYCGRKALCRNCGERKDRHAPLEQNECTQPAKCANCYGPFPADHEDCPCKPQRENGTVIPLA